MKAKIYFILICAVCSFSVKGQFTYRVTNVSCFGDNDGSIHIYPAGYVYKWSNNEIGVIDTALIANTYRCTVYDTTTGVSIDSFNIQVNEPAPVTNTLNTAGPNCLTGTNGSIVITVSGGTPPYGYAITGNAISRTVNTTGIFDSLPAGGYYILTGDSNGCAAQDSITLLADTAQCTTGINNILPAQTLLVFPNPANNQLFIKTENINPQSIAVYDVDGRLIFTQAFKPEIEINHLSSGVYFIEVTSNEGVARKRIVKM